LKVCARKFKNGSVCSERIQTGLQATLGYSRKAQVLFDCSVIQTYRRRTIVRLLLLFLLLIIRRIRRSRQPKRAFWVRPIYQRRVELGEYHNLIQEMRLQDNESFFRYFRMIPSQFDRLLDLVGPSIMYQDTRWRQCITAGQRLAITLR
jgi:hypothetical protein